MQNYLVIIWGMGSFQFLFKLIIVILRVKNEKKKKKDLSPDGENCFDAIKLICPGKMKYCRTAVLGSFKMELNKAFQNIPRETLFLK